MPRAERVTRSASGHWQLTWWRTRERSCASWMISSSRMDPRLPWNSVHGLQRAVAPQGLGVIRTLQLQALQVFRRDVPGHVLTREARGVELGDRGIVVTACG